MKQNDFIFWQQYQRFLEMGYDKQTALQLVSEVVETEQKQNTLALILD